MEQEIKKKKLPLWSKIIIWVIGSIVGLFVVVWGGFNILKYPIYANYYGRMENLGPIPGLNSGFVPQGICVSEENNIYILSGYRDSKKPSEIYLTGGNNNKDFETKCIKLYKNGAEFKGHVGGIATTGDNVYISNGSRIYIVSLTELLNSTDNKIDIGEGVMVNSSASFVFTDDNYLYTGEFHDGGKYQTNHPYTTNDGVYHAIIEKYDIKDIDNNTGNKPLMVISIRNNVQGFAISPEGNLYLSTSYGLTSSIYYKYPTSSLSQTSQLFLDDVPVYYLDGEYETLYGPAMSEDLDYSNGKLICSTESGCNKYVFGKFFFANYFFSLDF